MSDPIQYEFNRMFNNISEIQRISGRGEATSPLGKGLDFISIDERNQLIEEGFSIEEIDN